MKLKVKIFMSQTAEFYAGQQMKVHGTVLFQKCPLCGQAEILVETPTFLRLRGAKIKPCPSCRAEFVAHGSDKFQLVFCEPHKLVVQHNCKDRVFRGCYLGSTLPKSEWERIAKCGESSELTKFSSLSIDLRQGLLPSCLPEELGCLQPGETLHYISYPVYVDEQRLAQRKNLAMGKFFLTSRRIVYESQSRAHTIQLENIERVEESPPGFLVKEKGFYEPRYFFPPSYDPVYSAVLGAIRNLKRKRS
jgi:hypothetical protein